MSLAVALLVAGYALAVPPLLRIRHLWRTRSWPAYAAEVAGAALITIGWAFYGGRLPAAVINAVWLFGFGIAFPLFAGGRRR